MTIRFVVDAVSDGDDGASADARADHLVRARFPAVDRAFALKLLKAGRISIDGATATLAMRAKSGSVVVVDIADGRLGDVLEKTPASFTLLHQADGLIIVDKRDGIAMHEGMGVGPGRPARGRKSDVDDVDDEDGDGDGGTPLSGLLARRFPIEPGFNGPSFLGRLDRPTSGLVVAAMSQDALSSVLPTWRDGGIRKEYVVVVVGKTEPSGMIDVPLAGRRPRQRGTGVIESAKTGYTTVAHGNGVSVVVAELFTGRTHQIRRHMKAIGHAIVGDTRYGARGDDGSTGLMLHAWRLRRATGGDGGVDVGTWPERLPESIEATWPQRMTSVMQNRGVDVAVALVRARAVSAAPTTPATPTPASPRGKNRPKSAPHVG